MGAHGPSTKLPNVIQNQWNPLLAKTHGRARALTEVVELNNIKENPLLLKNHGRSRALIETVEFNTKSMKIIILETHGHSLTLNETVEPNAQINGNPLLLKAHARPPTDPQ